MDLLGQDKLAILQGVGYPNPNRSHFRAMDIWQSAQPERDAPISGWLPRSVWPWAISFRWPCKASACCH